MNHKQLAEEYAFNIFRERYESFIGEEQEVYSHDKDAFLAGFKAGQEEILEYARHVSSSGQMTILSPIPNDKRNFCRKGVVVMFEDLKRYTDNSQE